MLHRTKVLRRRPRLGFSFAEILFAVAVLGIGFIMVAAIFPVAIGQTQAAMDETVGAAATRSGVELVGHSVYLNSATLPYTDIPPAVPGALSNPARMCSFYDPRLATRPGGLKPTILNTPGPADKALFFSIRKDLIDSNDPRFATVALYARAEGASFARVTVIGLRVRGREEFTDADTIRPATGCAELEPKPVSVTLTEGNTNPDIVVIDNIANAVDADLSALSIASAGRDAAGEGAYLIISDDRIPDDVQTGFGGAATPSVNEYGRNNGRVYQLGAARPDLGPYTYELAAGADMTCQTGADNTFGTGDDVTENIPWRPVGTAIGATPRAAVAFIVGRGYLNPTVPGVYGGSVEALQKHESIVALP